MFQITFNSSTLSETLLNWFLYIQSLNIFYFHFQLLNIISLYLYGLVISECLFLLLNSLSKSFESVEIFFRIFLLHIYLGFFNEFLLSLKHNYPFLTSFQICILIYPHHQTLLLSIEDSCS